MASERKDEARQLSLALDAFDVVLKKLYGPAPSVTIVELLEGAWVISKLDEATTIRMLELALEQMRHHVKTTYHVDDPS